MRVISSSGVATAGALFFLFLLAKSPVYAESKEPLLEPGVRLFTSDGERRKLDRLKASDWQGVSINDLGQSSHAKATGNVTLIDYLGYIARDGGTPVKVLVGPDSSTLSADTQSAGRISKNGEKRFFVGDEKTITLKPGQVYKKQVAE